MINKNQEITTKSGIYCFRNKSNGKVYIGQAINIKVRFESHLRACFNRLEDSCLYRSLRKYGLENFDFNVICECPESQLDYWEIFYINYYCSNICKYGSSYGYNLTDGGCSGTLGYKWTDEQKDNQRIIQRNVMLKYYQTNQGKIKAKHHSEVMTGKKYSENTKQKHSIALKGHITTQETRDKISKANLGRKHTDIARKHMSESHIGKKPGNTGKHKVWDDDTHTKYHFE